MRTYKKIITKTIVSSALETAANIAVGVDSVALGQTSVTDPNVPTGSNIRGVLCQCGFSNPGTTSVEVGATLQYQLSGQSANVNPLAQGGDPQRNQVLKSWHFIVAQDSMKNINEYVKIPRKFQRIREGMVWRFVVDSAISVAREEALQFIYKARL